MTEEDGGHWISHGFNGESDQYSANSKLLVYSAIGAVNQSAAKDQLVLRSCRLLLLVCPAFQ